MSLRALSGHLAPIAAALAMTLALAACSSTGVGIVQTKTQGYDLSEDMLAQIRPGQSEKLVTLVLGTPQTTNTFSQETAWYYVETKLNATQIGINSVKERTVLAIYFDKSKKVHDKAVYSLKDGRVVSIESRRTPSFGEDKSFIDSLLSSI